MTLLDPITPGLPPTSDYAPTFRLRVNEKELDPTTMGDVIDLKVTMDLENLTGVDLTINNWDDVGMTFKYSDSTTFDVGNTIDVQMGYADRLRSVARGLISGLTPHFPESGPSTLGVSGVDSLFKLKGRKPNASDATKFTKMADWEIAQVIAQRNGLKVEVDREGQKYDFVVQKNQDDAQFLMERAKRIDFECYIRVNPDTGDETLYFKKYKGTAAATTRPFEFEYGSTLINFNPVIHLGNQVAAVTVRSWNPATKQPIVFTATSKDLPGGAGGGASGADVVASKVNNKHDVIVDQPVTSFQEARELAISLLNERSGGYLTGSGQIIGLPDLRPGLFVKLTGLGTRFSTTYKLKTVTHTLNSSGFLTQFEVTTQTDGGTSAGGGT